MTDVLLELPEPILIVGGYGYRNVGDEAILAGLLERLAHRRVTVVSRSPAETSPMHGVRSVSIGNALPELLRHRSVIIGGGGLFGRDMGSLGRLLPGFGLLSQGMGRAVALIGVGIDSDQSGPGARLLRILARRAVAVEVRDAASLDVLRSWEIDAVVRPDLSSLMPALGPEIGRSILNAAGVDRSRPVIGLCLTAVDAALAEALSGAVAPVVDRFPDVEFVFIPMSQHPFVMQHNDGELARSLQARAPRIRVVEGSHHPAAIRSVFESLTAAVCMRYHSLLFAHDAGVPIVALPYAAKCRAWLAEHGMPSTEPTVEALTDAVRSVLPALPTLPVLSLSR
jgi:polysaccharide pyruvyl transferase WcaK-like protein